MSIEKKLRNIENFGRRALDTFSETDINIGNADKTDILENERTAFLFFLQHCFYRGRSDELSKRYFHFTESVINEFWTEGLPLKSFISNIRADEQSDKFSEISNEHHKIVENLNFKGYQQFTANLINNKVNNYKDINMIISVMEYTFTLNDNISRHTLSKLKAGQIESIFKELKKIYGIADKLSSFYLRNMCFLYEPDIAIRLKPEELKCLLPVDTWILKVYNSIAIVNKNDNVRESMINLCKEYDVDPLLFNQGCWYVGFHSFEIVLENIERMTLK